MLHCAIVIFAVILNLLIAHSRQLCYNRHINICGYSGYNNKRKDGAGMSVMAALGIIGGIALIAVIVVAAAVVVTVTGAFNSIKDEEI